MAIERGVGAAVLGFVATAVLAFAQAIPVPPDESYPEPVDVPSYFPTATLASKGMVTAAHPLAARVGADVLQRGGNAMDATLAVQMVLNVVEPQSSGIGGGCFILYYDARTRQVHAFDGREETPANCRREDFLDPGGKVIPDSLTGGLPVGVPGTVAGTWLAHERFGTLPPADLLAPAIALAENGIGVTPRLRVSIAANRARFLRFPSSRAAFLGSGDTVPELGEVLKQPDFAKTLRLLAEHGPRVFYEGEIARDVVQAVRNAPYRPGRLTEEDMKQYRAVERAPVRFAYRGHEVVSFPPPSSGGITLRQILGILETVNLKELAPGSLEETDWLARAGAVAFADRNAYLGDQDWSPGVPMKQLLRDDYVRGRADTARQLRPGEKARPGGLAAGVGGGQGEGRDTTHFSIVDRQGNVVACTTTIEHGMGSGLVVPGRGFLLNNELTDFDLDLASGPNALDATRKPRQSAIDQPATIGGKRPRSSMTPVIVFKDGNPVLTVGSPGGSLIIGTVAQILTNVLDHGMDVQQAINAPRVSSRNGPLELEAHYPRRGELLAALRARGWKIKENKPGYQVWGGAHGIRIRPDGVLEGGADPRREGAARGF